MLLSFSYQYTVVAYRISYVYLFQPPKNVVGYRVFTIVYFMTPTFLLNPVSFTVICAITKRFIHQLKFTCLMFFLFYLYHDERTRYPFPLHRSDFVKPVQCILTTSIFRRFLHSSKLHCVPKVSKGKSKSDKAVIVKRKLFLGFKNMSSFASSNSESSSMAHQSALVFYLLTGVWFVYSVQRFYVCILWFGIFMTCTRYASISST